MNGLKITTIAIATLFLAACGDSDDSDSDAAAGGNTTPYPEEFRTSFMEGCLGDGGGQALCDCVYAELEKTVPIGELVTEGLQMAGDDAPSDGFTETLTEASVRCALQTMGQE